MSDYNIDMRYNATTLNPPASAKVEDGMSVRDRTEIIKEDLLDPI